MQENKLCTIETSLVERRMTIPNIEVSKKTVQTSNYFLAYIDNHGSGYLEMAGWSKLTNFQLTLSWFKTTSGSNQLLYQLLLQFSLSQNIKLQLRKPFMYTI